MEKRKTLKNPKIKARPEGYLSIEELRRMPVDIEVLLGAMPIKDYSQAWVTAFTNPGESIINNYRLVYLDKKGVVLGEYRFDVHMSGEKRKLSLRE